MKLAIHFRRIGELHTAIAHTELAMASAKEYYAVEGGPNVRPFRDDPPALLLDLKLSMAGLAYGIGDSARALRLSQEVSVATANCEGVDGPRCFSTAIRLAAQCQNRLKNFREAADLLVESLDVRKKHLGDFSETYYRDWFRVGRFQILANAPEEGAATFRKIYNELEKDDALPLNSDRVAIWTAFSNASVGRFEFAKEVCRRFEEGLKSPKRWSNGLENEITFLYHLTKCQLLVGCGNGSEDQISQAFSHLEEAADAIEQHFKSDTMFRRFYAQTKVALLLKESDPFSLAQARRELDAINRGAKQAREEAQLLADLIAG